jgi:hypothetical protein
MVLCTDLALGGLFQKQVVKYRRKYGPYLLLVAAAVITVVIAFLLPPAAGSSYAWLGVAVGFGWLVHLLGDFITKNGIPAWPLPIRGKLWYDLALPSALRITAGGPFENVILVPVFSVATVGLFIYDIILYSGLIH